MLSRSQKRRQSEKNGAGANNAAADQEQDKKAKKRCSTRVIWDYPRAITETRRYCAANPGDNIQHVKPGS